MYMWASCGEKELCALLLPCAFCDDDDDDDDASSILIQFFFLLVIIIMFSDLC